MAKRIFSLIIPLLFLFYASDVSSQEIRRDTTTITRTKIIRVIKLMTVPKFILQFSLAYNAGSLELSAHNGGFSREDFILGKNYGARNGYGVSVTGKLPLNKKGKFWLDAGAGFNRFESNLIAKNTGEGKVAYNVISGGLGIDYNFTPAHKVKYFLGTNFLISSISGSATLNNPDSTSTAVKIKSSLRIGYNVFIGLEYAFEKSIGMNVGLKFTHANLLLKKNSANDSANTEINDKGIFPQQIYTGWKQFAFSTVFAGISYYFGVKQNRYKIP